MVQSVGSNFLKINQENNQNSSHSCTPFLFYKFRSNRGLTGHVVYNVLQRKRQVDHSPQPFESKKKKKENRLVTVRMIDVTDCPIFHPNKYALSGSALAASFGKHAQFFSDRYVTMTRNEIGKVEEIEPNIRRLPSENNFATSEGSFTDKDDLESLDEWVEENFLKNRNDFDYLKVLRHRMLNFKSKLTSGKSGSAHSSNVNLNSMNIIRKLGFSSKIRIDVLIEMTKLMEIEILNEIMTDLQTQRGLERSEMIQVENSFISGNDSDILMEDKLLFRIEGYKGSSYLVKDSNDNIVGEIRPKITLSSKHLHMNIVNHKNELRFIIRNPNTTSNRLFYIEDMTPKLAVSIGSTPTYQSKRISLKTGKIIKQATGFQNEICAPLKNMEIDFPPLCQSLDQVLLFGAMLVIELEYNVSKKQLQCSHPTLFY